VGYVPQDVVLFNDTLGVNILYARPDASEAELRAVVELAQLAVMLEIQRVLVA
jgi:ATP-binding cassette subfamily B protein